MATSIPLEDYRRYGRQMILDGIGLAGQVKLQEASVGVVGAGGLGCPALQYLGAAGVGRLGIIDHDIVELSNLQRQILHNETTVGMPKSESAALALKRINSHIKFDIIVEALSAENATLLLSPYDIILDCTDNAPTRYLLSDTCVSLDKPLVSGAAQKFEGQLCTYHFGPEGPCYRCLFPKPPAQENVGSCEQMGILGAVTGVIGNLQALEAIKIITGLAEKKPSLLLYNALGMPLFRSVKLRSRKPSCPACGEGSEDLISTTDYEQFCGGPRPNWVERGMANGENHSRISVKDFKAVVDHDTPHIIDVRKPTEFGICHLSGSTNVPLHDLVADPATHLPEDKTMPIYVVCRLGNDSQIGADSLRSVAPSRIIKDVSGGLRAWSSNIDMSFPVY